MDIILIPGMWLDAGSWEKVVPALEKAGHRALPLTLPGMESRDADRSRITRRDHVDTVVAAIDSLEPATRDPQRLTDERRYDVPITVICTEFTSAMLKGWIGRDLAPVREFTRIRDVEYVDLPTGHWPQFTRPDDLARSILTSADRGR